MGAALAFLTVALGGCLSIKSNDASQTTPGKITLKAVVCASKYAHLLNPDWTDCQPTNPGKLLFQDVNRADATTNGVGQLLVGFRVPLGTVGPPTFASKDGAVNLAQSQSYTTELQRLFPAPGDQQWIGYISAVKGYDPAVVADHAGEIDVEFRLPRSADGTPFATFRWREVVGFRQGDNADAPVACGNDPIGKYCVDSPPTAQVSSDVTTDVSDFGVLPGTGATVYAGTTAKVPFQLRYSDKAGLGQEGFSITATTEVPNTSAAADHRTVDAAPNSSNTVSALVPVPASTPGGRYTVTLSASNGAAGVTRVNAASIFVEPVPTPPSGSPPSTNSALVDNFWTPTPSGTTVRSLVVRHVPAKGKVTVSCRGRGCAFKSKTKKSGRKVNLTSLFRHRKLRPRTVVEIRVTGPNYIDKLFTFKMRKTKSPPLLTVRCMPPTAKKALPCS